jgi:hypothetical protein
LLPSADQLRKTYSELGTEFIHTRIASGELTETALAVAKEELQRRGLAEPPVAAEIPTPPAASTELEVVEYILDFLYEPFGWSWGIWIVVFVVCLLLVASFGITARQQTDQIFLYAVVVIQAAALSGVVRAFAAVFSFNSVAGTLGKIIAIGVLGVVIFALTVCSELAKHGWGGG